jgi:hypothetical protein
MEQLNPAEWYNNVPDDLLPLFLHHCMDRMCGRDGGAVKQLVPRVFPDEDKFEAVVELCQHSLMQWIDIRDKKEVSLSPNASCNDVFLVCSRFFFLRVILIPPAFLSLSLSLSPSPCTPFVARKLHSPLLRIHVQNRRLTKQTKNPSIHAFTNTHR